MYNASGTSVHIGFPIEEAVWRTNHGYTVYYTYSQPKTNLYLRTLKHVYMNLQGKV